jgi:hypothetical protein
LLSGLLVCLQYDRGNQKCDRDFGYGQHFAFLLLRLVAKKQ